MKLQELLDKEIDSIGDDHIGSNSEDTPLKEGYLNNNFFLRGKQGAWIF